MRPGYRTPVFTWESTVFIQRKCWTPPADTVIDCRVRRQAAGTTPDAFKCSTQTWRGKYMRASSNVSIKQPGDNIFRGESEQPALLLWCLNPQKAETQARELRGVWRRRAGDRTRAVLRLSIDFLQQCQSRSKSAMDFFICRMLCSFIRHVRQRSRTHAPATHKADVRESTRFGWSIRLGVPSSQPAANQGIVVCFYTPVPLTLLVPGATAYLLL